MNAETGSVSAEEAIRNLVEKWVVWRDSGEWDRFATVWHDDGVMMATWFQGTAADVHPDESGRRGSAASESSTSSEERGGCGVVSRGGPDQDDDFAARPPPRRRVRRRLHRPVLRLLREARERLGARATPADLREGSPRSRRPVDQPFTRRSDSGRFPTGYRHLAYLQTLIGYEVKGDMPGLTGPEVEELYRDGASWLAGGSIDHRLVLRATTPRS